jgi:dienelactone hydrolase
MDTPQFHLQNHLSYLYANQPRQLAFHAESRDEYASWKRKLRAKVMELLGIAGRALPSTVSVIRLRSIDRGRYIEEKYGLDVGETVHAPMYLLIPKTPPPHLAMLVFHGHIPDIQYMLGNFPDETTANDFRATDGHYAQTLAEAGYLVCAIEQRGFGERKSDQIIVRDNQNSCRHLSLEYLMQGRTMIGERCWDGMVALSYLQGRDDVVQDRIGCTGLSGGGTTALWLSALDERVTVAVPACYFCSFKHSILGMEHCECNYVPRILEYGEMGDLTALIAPRPLRIIAGEQDPIFPIEGVKQQFETVQRAYQLLDVHEHCSLTIHPGEHSYDSALSLEWFDRWLLNTNRLG